VFKKREDVALRDVVSGHGGNGLPIEQDNLGGLSNLNDSKIATHLFCTSPRLGQGAIQNAYLWGWQQDFWGSLLLEHM